MAPADSRGNRYERRRQAERPTFTPQPTLPPTTGQLRLLERLAHRADVDKPDVSTRREASLRIELLRALVRRQAPLAERARSTFQPPTIEGHLLNAAERRRLSRRALDGDEQAKRLLRLYRETQP